MLGGATARAQFKTNFGIQVRDARLRDDLTQAALVGTDQATIAAVELGQADIGMDLLADLAIQLHISDAGLVMDKQTADVLAALEAFDHPEGDGSDPYAEKPADENDRPFEEMSFLDAYCSNHIEGIEFDIDEAAGIIFKGKFPHAREHDAHDLLGTYRVLSDRRGIGRTPRTFDDLLEITTTRHAIIMAGRASAMPGQFKERPNRRAGRPLSCLNSPSARCGRGAASCRD